MNVAIIANKSHCTDAQGQVNNKGARQERGGVGREGVVDCLGIDGLGLSYVSSTAAYSGGKRRQQ